MILSSPSCLRQRQLLQTRQAILHAAHELVADRGFSSVSVQDISEAAGVSPRTFFNHFRSKDEALVPGVPDFTSQQRRSFLDASGTDLLTALENLLTDHLVRILEFAGSEGELYTATRLAQSNPELLPRILSVFDDFKHQVAALVAERTDLSPDDLSCTVVADAALSTARAAIHRWSRLVGDGGRPDLATLLPAAFSTLRDLVGRDTAPTP